MLKNDAKKSSRGLRSIKTIGAIVLVASIILVIVWLKVVRGAEDPTSNFATFVAKRGPLTISVLETGTIMPRDQITLRNEVEGRSSIVSIVPDGSQVKAGDLLVELDASNLKDAIIDQDILLQKAEAAYISAQENLAVIENQAKSDIDVSTLKLKFARQDLVQYEEGQYPKDVNDVTAKIRLAEEELKRAEDVNDWSERLYQEKYLSESEYRADGLAVQRRRLERDSAMADLDLLADFTYHRQIDQLTSDVSQAEMELERTKRKASADVIQAKAELRSSELQYNRQQDKMNKLKDQLEKTRIFAPQDGMVVYATSSGRRSPWDRDEPLEVGIEVAERKELINLPTATSMKARVNIHETSLEKVPLGLPAVITIDALPGTKFLGRLDSIAPLPDARAMHANPDLKIYPADILLEDNSSGLRTGMSCKAEIIIAQYEDAVYIPVQAVLRVGGEPTVYVVKDGTYTERKVELGLDDNRMIRIISGLDEGEVVLMTPPLEAGVLEPGSRTAGAVAPDALDISDPMRERVNEKLEEANGTEPVTPSDNIPGPPQARPGGRGFEMPSSEQMEQMRRRFESMSPEEQKKEMERMRQRFENMSPEEREGMRQRSQSSGSGQRREQRQGGGVRDRGSERNQ